ncbi:MAG TPA: imidazole glycerol phosphate synthase subunit HisH [Streptosporangiaceae bacterium]|nr:imidazole glycerol phosphate synthase subunit HisH [Streptosporangiaceae bacterium]
MSRRPRVTVLDYGSGNLRSAQRALARAGADAEVTADLAAAYDADGLVVPGVGAFAACVAGLRGIGGDQVITKRLGDARPVLGICVGMQVLFEAGVEHGQRVAGVGCWPGVVDRLDAPVLPHMGWNSVVPAAGSALLAGLGPDPMFYFVHSYAARDVPAGMGGAGAEVSASSASDHSKRGLARAGRAPLVTWATHGQRFAAAAEDGPLMATQFHPEKSGDAGAQLLANWLETLR